MIERRSALQTPARQTYVGPIGLSLCLMGMLLAPPVSAQLRGVTSGVALPGSPRASADGPEAMELNPASLAFIESWGLSYQHVDGAGSTPLSGRGDALYAATPLLFGVSGGLSVEHLRQSSALAEAARARLSLGLAWSPDRAISLGAALRVLASEDVRLSGLTSVDVAGAFRPVDWLALSFQARDLLSSGLGGPRGGAIERSYWLSAGLRPLSDRRLVVDLTGAIDEGGRIGAQITTEVTTPYIGRLRAGLLAEGLEGGVPTNVQATLGVSIDWGQLGVSGGVIGGDALESNPGWHVGAHYEGANRAGVPEGRVILDLRLSGLGPRGIVAISRLLERAAWDHQIAGVLLRPRGSGVGLAYAQELRLLISALREAGKPVICHLEDATGSEWYACAGADRILIDPAGGVRVAGVSSELFLAGDLLRNLGIRADFVRIGRHKSAIEQYLNRAQSGPAHDQRAQILDGAYNRLVFDASEDLERTPAEVRTIMDSGPYLPGGAASAGLIDAQAGEREMDAHLRQAYGGSFPRESEPAWRVPERWGNRPYIGVVMIDGTITDGDNVDIPILGIHMSGGRTVTAAIDALAADPRAMAIVVRIDSPGGSVLASDQIYRAIARARAHKPVIASMGAVAASGGYYVAAAAHEIWANPTTLTGSIGVWFGKVDFAPLAAMIGLELSEMGRGAHAGATSLYRAFTDDERALLANHVRHWYSVFLGRVAQGRSMERAEVDALGRGRILTGDAASRTPLIDHLGGFQSALASARQRAGVGREVDIRVSPGRPSTLLDYALSALGVGSIGGGGPVGSLGAAPREEDALGHGTGDSSGVAGALQNMSPELRALLSTAMTLSSLSSNSPAALMPEVSLPR